VNVALMSTILKAERVMGAKARSGKSLTTLSSRIVEQSQRHVNMSTRISINKVATQPFSVPL